MPGVLIEARKTYSKGEEVSSIDAIHAALVDAFQIKLTDKSIRLVAHEPHRFAQPPTLSQPGCFTHIPIDVFTGWSI